MARKFAGKGLHFVMADEGKQSADMAAMKLTDLGVVSHLISFSFLGVSVIFVVWVMCN